MCLFKGCVVVCLFFEASGFNTVLETWHAINTSKTVKNNLNRHRGNYIPPQRSIRHYTLPTQQPRSCTHPSAHSHLHKYRYPLSTLKQRSPKHYPLNPLIYRKVLMTPCKSVDHIPPFFNSTYFLTCRFVEKEGKSVKLGKWRNARLH